MSEPFDGARDAFYEMVAKDPPPSNKTVTSQLLDEQFASGPRVPTTRIEEWVDEPGPDGRMGGRWVFVEAH